MPNNCPFQTLEELCITDIIASRHLCDSVMSQESVSETWTESDFSSCVVTPPESLNLFNLPTLSKSEAIGSHSSSVDDGRSFEVEILPVHNDSGPTLSHETPEKEIKDSLWGSDGQSDPIDMNSNCGPPKKSDRNSFTKPKFLQLDNDLNPGKSTIRRLSLSTQQIEHISINRISRTGSPQFRSLTSSHEVRLKPILRCKGCC